jgi:FkbM family methyltransferase
VRLLRCGEVKFVFSDKISLISYYEIMDNTPTEQTIFGRCIFWLTEKAQRYVLVRPLQSLVYWLYQLPAQITAVWQGKNLITISNNYGRFFARPFTQTVSKTNPASNRQIQSWINESPEGIFVDIGAGVGLLTNSALGYGSARKVFAFEPNPSSYPLLLKHISANNLNAEPIHAALGKSAGTLEMPPNTVHTKSSSTCGGSGVRIPTVSLDQFAADQDINRKEITTIKVDSHGHELPALEGMQKTLHALPEDARLIVRISTMGDARDKTLAFIKWCGFTQKDQSGGYYLFTKSRN